MLAARGVSLGLSKINFAEINKMPLPNRVLLNRIVRQKKKRKKKEQKVFILKYVDKQVIIFLLNFKNKCIKNHIKNIY